jgi:hypothetical protein
MRKAILRFVLPVVLGLTLGVLLIVLFENKLIYFPAKYPEGSWQPGTYSLRAEDCFFRSDDGVQLHGWFFPVDTPRATLLWCHGNAGNITHRLDNAWRLLRLGVSVFIFDYRGYGRSEGTPSEEGLYLDAMAAYRFVTEEKHVNASALVIFGRSIGASVAVDLASRRPCGGVILESAFTSAKDVASELWPFLPIRWFVRSQFDAASKIGRINVPILFTHGTRDATVPLRLGQKLFGLANEPKWFYQIEGADHNDTYIVGGERYFRRIGEFISTISNCPEETSWEQVRQ